MNALAQTQRKTASASRPSAPASDTGRISGGQALDRRTNAEMSAKFGHDFSSVRIHTDSRAEDSAHALGANAYALGSNIVFGEGKYNPGSHETERLLAHELTHVAQQDRFGPGNWRQASRRGDASEREADALASKVMLGQSVQVQAAPGAAVARDSNGAEGASGDEGQEQQVQTVRPVSDQPYQGDYPWSTPSGDALSSLAWDIGGAIPGIGTGVNGAGLLIDAAKAGHDMWRGEDASAHWHNVEQDALGMIPGVGTALGYGSIVTDSAALIGRLTGGSASEFPTASEFGDQGAKALHQAVSTPFDVPGTNTDSSNSGGGGAEGAGGADYADNSVNEGPGPARPLTPEELQSVPAPTPTVNVNDLPLAPYTVDELPVAVGDLPRAK